MPCARGFTADPRCGPDSRGDPGGARTPLRGPTCPRAAPPALWAQPGLVLTAGLVLAAAPGPWLGGPGGAPRGPPARPDLSAQSPSSAGERLVYSSTESTVFSKIHVRCAFISRSGRGRLGPGSDPQTPVFVTVLVWPGPKRRKKPASAPRVGSGLSGGSTHCSHEVC